MQLLPLFTSSSPFAKTYEEMSQLGVYRQGEDRFSASQGAGFLSLSLPPTSLGVSGSSIVSQHSGLFAGSQTWGLRNTVPEPALLFPLSHYALHYVSCWTNCQTLEGEQ